jgi:hypothetical protein
MLKDIANESSSILDNFFADVLSKFPGLKVEAEATIQPPILNDQSVMDWLHLTEAFSAGYPGLVRYLATKEASGRKLTRETVTNAQVCVRCVFSSYVMSSHHHTAALQCGSEV